MIWIQPPGTPTMGHLFLDAYHATGDEYYYQAAEQVAGALIWAQHPSGGWNYIVDFAGERRCASGTTPSARTPGGSRSSSTTTATPRSTMPARPSRRSSCCGCTSRSGIRNTRPPLDKAIQFVLDSQYPIGAWPQRYPLRPSSRMHGLPDYTSYITFNDDVAAENIDFLMQCYQALGDERLLDPIMRGMNAFIVMQRAAAAGLGAAVHARTCKPAGARTYEPNALVTHTTARQHRAADALLPPDGRHEVSGAHPGGARLARKLTLPAGVAPRGPHPSDLHRARHQQAALRASRGLERRQRPVLRRQEPREDDRPLQLVPPHRRAGLRPAVRAAAGDVAGRGHRRLAARWPRRRRAAAADTRGAAVAAPRSPRRSAGSTRRATGRRRLGYNSHPFSAMARRRSPPGDFSQTHVGDDTDTSPYPGRRDPGHFDRGLHPAHERADPGPRRAPVRCPHAARNRQGRPHRPDGRARRHRRQRAARRPEHQRRSLRPVVVGVRHRRRVRRGRAGVGGRPARPHHRRQAGRREPPLRARPDRIAGRLRGRPDPRRRRHRRVLERAARGRRSPRGAIAAGHDRPRGGRRGARHHVGAEVPRRATDRQRLADRGRVERRDRHSGRARRAGRGVAGGARRPLPGCRPLRRLRRRRHRHRHRRPGDPRCHAGAGRHDARRRSRGAAARRRGERAGRGRCRQGVRSQDRLHLARGHPRRGRSGDDRRRVSTRSPAPSGGACDPRCGGWRTCWSTSSRPAAAACLVGGCATIGRWPTRIAPAAPSTWKKRPPSSPARPRRWTPCCAVSPTDGSRRTRAATRGARSTSSAT